MNTPETNAPRLRREYGESARVVREFHDGEATRAVVVTDYLPYGRAYVGLVTDDGEFVCDTEGLVDADHGRGLGHTFDSQPA